MANVNYTITGNATDAEKAVDRLRARFEKLEEKLRLGATHSRRNSQQAVSGFRQQATALATYVAQFASVGVAIGGAQALFRQFLADHEKLLQLRNQIAETIPVVEIRARNQGRFNKAEFQDVRESTAQAVKDIPVSNLLQGFRAQEELTSQGFDRDEIISGAALRAVRNLQLSTNQFGEEAIDVKELIKSLATALKNQPGRDKTVALKAEDIKALEPKFVSLFEATPIQFADLIPFARIESVLGNRGLDLQTQLAAFVATLEGSGSGDVAATSLNQVTAFLQRSATSGIKGQLAKKNIDIDTSQFDLIGEDLPTALENLGKELDRLVTSASTEEAGLIKRTEALNTIFGARNQAAATTLIPAADRIRELRETIGASLTDTSLIPDRRTAFQESTFARQQRTEVVRDTASRQGLQSQGDVSAKELANIFSTVSEKLSDDTQASAFFSVTRSLRKVADQLLTKSGQEILDNEVKILREQAFKNQFDIQPGLDLFGGPQTAFRVLQALEQTVAESRTAPPAEDAQILTPAGITRADIDKVTQAFLTQNPEAQTQIIQAEGRLQTSRAQNRAILQDPANPFEERMIEALNALRPSADAAAQQQNSLDQQTTALNRLVEIAETPPEGTRPATDRRLAVPNRGGN